MKMYSVLVHNQKIKTVIGTLCIEAENASAATRIGMEVVRQHQKIGTLNAHASVMPALDASQIKHLDWLDATHPVDPNHVRGRSSKERVRRMRPHTQTQKPAQETHWWPRLRVWWATRHQQFDANHWQELPVTGRSRLR